MVLASRMNLLCVSKLKNSLLASYKCYSVCHFKRGIVFNLESMHLLQFSRSPITILQHRFQSTDKESNQKVKEPVTTEISTENKLSQRARFKQAIRDYGATIIVFHVAISLTSLGICYAAISNGVDAVSLLTRLHFPESVISSKVAVGGSTFVMAYAVHKLFAPARIAITLSSAPFIVRYLRKINLIKPPK